MSSNGHSKSKSKSNIPIPTSPKVAPQQTPPTAGGSGYVYRPAPRSALSPRRTPLVAPPPAPVVTDDFASSHAAKHIAKAKAKAAAQFQEQQEARAKESAQAQLTRKSSMANVHNASPVTPVQTVNYAAVLAAATAAQTKDQQPKEPQSQPQPPVSNGASSAVAKFLSKLHGKHKPEPSAPPTDSTNGTGSNTNTPTPPPSAASNSTNTSASNAAAKVLLALMNNKQPAASAQAESPRQPPSYLAAATSPLPTGTNDPPTPTSARRTATNGPAPPLEKKASVAKASPWDSIASAALLQVRGAKAANGTATSTTTTTPAQPQPPTEQPGAATSSTSTTTPAATAAPVDHSNEPGAPAPSTAPAPAPTPAAVDKKPSLGRMKSPWSAIASAALNTVRENRRSGTGTAPATVASTTPTHATKVPEEKTQSPIANGSVQPVVKDAPAATPAPAPLARQPFSSNNSSSNTPPVTNPSTPSSTVRTLSSVATSSSSPQPAAVAPSQPTTSSSFTNGTPSKRASGGKWDFLASSAIQSVRERNKNVELLMSQNAAAEAAMLAAANPSPQSSIASSPVLGSGMSPAASPGASPLMRSLSLAQQSSGSLAGGVGSPSSAGRFIASSSAMLLSAGKLVVQSIPISVSSLAPGQVLVEPKAVGICGSDVHYLQNGRIGNFVVREPMILGHECAGRVVAVGPGVTTLSVGDRVAVEPGISCGVCELCKGGRYNLCASMKFLATPPVHGALTNLLSHPAHLCHKLPSALTYEEGALCEPLSVAIHACRRSGMQFGHSVLICGAGPIGLVVAMVARASGARKIVLTDISLQRLRMAQEILARGDDCVAVVHTQPSESEEDVLKKIKLANGGDSPDVSFECSGASSASILALRATKSGGVLVLIGIGAEPILSLPVTTEMLVREVDVRGVFRYANTYPTAIAMIHAKRVAVNKLVTHRVNLRSEADSTANASHSSIEPRDLGLLDSEQLLAGFETARTGATAIKVMFTL